MTGEEGAKPAPAKKAKKAAGGDKAKKDGGDAAATPAAAKRAQKAAEAKAAKQQGALCVDRRVARVVGGKMRCWSLALHQGILACIAFARLQGTLAGRQRPAIPSAPAAALPLQRRSRRSRRPLA